MTALDIEAFFLLTITLPVGALPMKGNIPLFSISREQLTVTYTLKVLFICSQDCSFVSGKEGNFVSSSYFKEFKIQAYI